MAGLLESVRYGLQRQGSSTGRLTGYVATSEPDPAVDAGIEIVVGAAIEYFDLKAGQNLYLLASERFPGTARVSIFESG